MFRFEQILVPVYIRQVMENLAAENAELRQQVAEQADLLHIIRLNRSNLKMPDIGNYLIGQGLLKTVIAGPSENFV